MSLTERRVQLSDVAFDAGTQIRATINEAVVAEYAERMTDGVRFPPIVLFHDGNQHYLADGFHRFMAAKRNEFRYINAVVHPGTKQDALWFALGANRDHGLQMTERDKQQAVRLAIETWPDKLHKDIAAHVGCSTSLVSKVSSKFTSESGEKTVTGKALRDRQKRDAVVAAIDGGVKDADSIASLANVSKSFVSKVRAELGLQCFDRSRAGVVKRRKEIREMAERGYTSKQIAAAIGLDERTVPVIAKEEGIDIPADRAVGKIRRHDSNRIVSQIVADAENLTEGVDLVDFSELDRAQLLEWLKSLQESRDKLGAFIRRLTKEQQRGEAA